MGNRLLKYIKGKFNKKSYEEFVNLCITEGLTNIYRFNIEDMEEYKNNKFYILFGDNDPHRDKVEYWNGEKWVKFDE